MQQEPAIEEAARKHPRLKEVLEVACKVEGMARNLRNARGRRGDFPSPAAWSWSRFARPAKTKLSPSTTW